MTIYVFLYVIPGDKTLAKQSTVIRILPSMTRNVSLQGGAKFESIATHSTIVCCLPSMTFHVPCLFISGAGAEVQLH